MRYVLQVVLSNAQHPEYGQATIPFPIPNQNYDSTIELLGPLEIGDTLRQDCQVDELDSFYTLHAQARSSLYGTRRSAPSVEKRWRGIPNPVAAHAGGVKIQSAAAVYILMTASFWNEWCRSSKCWLILLSVEI